VFFFLRREHEEASEALVIHRDHIMIVKVFSGLVALRLVLRSKGLMLRAFFRLNFKRESYSSAVLQILTLEHLRFLLRVLHPDVTFELLKDLLAND